MAFILQYEKEMQNFEDLGGTQCWVARGFGSLENQICWPPILLLPPPHPQERQWMSKYEANVTCGNLNSVTFIQACNALVWPPMSSNQATEGMSTKNDPLLA